jgi:hypothetical protein
VHGAVLIALLWSAGCWGHTEVPAISFLYSTAGCGTEDMHCYESRPSDRNVLEALKSIMANKQLFKDQLPKYQPWGWERLLTAIGSVAVVVALFITFLKLDHLKDDIQNFIFIIELSVLCGGLILYLWITSRKKLHRFAQAAFFIHYVNHLIRDEVAAAEAGKQVELKALLQDVVDAVAGCFSILTARRARCSIHEIREGGYVALTRTESRKSDEKPNSIGDNTDFKCIWYGTHRCRFLLFQKSGEALAH